MKKPYIIVCCVVLIALAFFSGQWILELRAEEPRRALVSMEMILSGDYLHPQVNGSAYYNKPPLFNWVQVGFFKLFGSFDEWVARMPSLLSFLGMCLAVYFLARTYINERAGVIAGLMSLTSADILFYGSVNSGEIDLFYSLVVLLQVASIYHFSETKRWLLVFYAHIF